MTLELPETKRQLILSIIKKFKTLQSCTIREFAQFVGNITAACPAVQYGWAYSKGFERQKYLALLKTEGNYDAKMRLSATLRSDFVWWESHISNAINPIKQQKYALEIFSDASLTGWGAACNGENTYGAWDKAERSAHINYLELVAAFYALRCFAVTKYDCEILLRIDNTTAVAYINRMGGIQYPHLNSITRKIWQWCERRNLWITASYIASKENVEADQGSRIINIDTEWELAPEAFQAVVRRFGIPEIDLFASKNNKKCRKFCSWHRDPEAFCVDAFTIKWTEYKFYAFPPFALILRVLRKIQVDQAEGVLIVPYWKSQPWFPLWKSMLTSQPLYFEPNQKLLLSACRKIHPLAGKMTLVEIVRKNFRRLNINEDAVELLLNSVTQSTQTIFKTSRRLGHV